MGEKADQQQPIQYYWQPFVASRAYLIFMWFAIPAWFGLAMTLPALSDARYPILFILIPLGIAILAKSMQMKHAVRRAISIYDDRLVVHTFKGEFGIFFRDVCDVRYRNSYWELVFNIGAIQPWGWERSSIKLFTRNPFNVFHVPAGRSVDALPQQLLKQIKTRVAAAHDQRQ